METITWGFSLLKNILTPDEMSDPALIYPGHSKKHVWGKWDSSAIVAGFNVLNIF